jgi:hypothetical protein
MLDFQLILCYNFKILYFDLSKMTTGTQEYEFIVHWSEEHCPELIELGSWEDLVYLVSLLREKFPKIDFRLDRIRGKKNQFLFIEDAEDQDSYDCGLILRRKGKAYAFSPDVHAFVMGSYDRLKMKK